MRSNIEWRHWGRIDPLYGVSTLPGKSRLDSQPWTDSEFYALGAHEWSEHLSQWQTYGLRTSSCVEIGCGAGRITQQLVHTFDHVYALDVSPEMIAYARARVTPSERVSYFVTEGQTIPVPSESASAVFSSHVFQHFEAVDDSLIYWEEIYRVLEPGGTMFVQLPVHRWPWAPTIFGAIYGARRKIGATAAWFKRRRLQAGGQQLFARLVSYDGDWLLRTLASIGYARIELRCIALPEGAYWALLAERPQPGLTHRPR
ncbi:MAG: class I SAM-dependent methyltransferase [Chloroflexi bacterium]|nr:class I SAM-dependent methyltransferase [Chloroflexota bacterium]MBV9599101.1 class I SAM-dependent methyltransferase [Chloroflexota bacterium]